MSCNHHNHGGGQAYPELNFSPGNKWVKGLTKNRINTMTQGHFSNVNLSSVLFADRRDDAEHVKLEVWSAPGRTKPGFEEAIKQKFKPAKKGDSFGPSWVSYIIDDLITVNIPASWAKHERVQFEFDPGCEAMIFTTDGVPLQGITGGYAGDRRVEFILPPEARKKGTFSFVIEQTCNGMFGVPWSGDTIDPPDMNRYYKLDSADLIVPNMPAWHLMWDVYTLRQLVETLPGNSELQNKALVTANKIMNVFDHLDPDSIGRARKVAEDVFGEGWAEKGAKIWEEGPKKERVYGIGHCHIDTAWLWPYSATQQKVARSWSTQIDLMERYPEHRFACSSAQQYKWLEQLYPALFERVKAKIASNQFHPVGGQWLESDGNMPSGEAFARQFIFGQRYFESKFGIRCEVSWLPDSFGLNGALPQLIRGAGMKYFFTQKLSWNNINTFPHSTFNWIGIDGTQVLCHMTPVETYTAQATIGDVVKGATNNKNTESAPNALLVFGNGDGGGGPLPPMLENMRRMRAVGNNNRDLPVVSMGKSVDDFFHDLDNDTEHGKVLPNWHGELYLEFHRGTYTSHGSIKKGNRKSEILLRDVEHLATLASLYSKDDYKYPQEQINDLWENVLLNQFHDVLPGSAIGMVYDDAEKIYAHVAKEGKALLEAAFKVIAPKSVAIPLTGQTFQASSNGKILAYNSTPFPRLDVVQVPLAGSGGNKLRVEAVQVATGGNTGFVLVDATEGSGFGKARGLFADVKPASVMQKSADVFVLMNAFITVTISNGRITSLVDNEQARELIPEGESGGLIIYDDRPNYWDAWDVEIHHLEKPHPIQFTNLKVTETGPIRASLEAEIKYGQSTIKTTISLDAISATMKRSSRSFLRFDAEVDWHERHKFLKFTIPLNIHNDNAVYEAPFGWVQRPTHKNTSWDIAKFEVCGHKYADLSEYGYGVAILSESKYGFATHGNVMSISLLRAATAPDAEQDQGKHEFSWAVLPHVGHFLESDVPTAAYFFNSPLHLRYLAEDRSPQVPISLHKAPFSVAGAPNVVLDTIKRSDDEDWKSKKDGKSGFIVLRLYEAFGGHARAELKIAGHLDVKKATITNLLEDELEVLDVSEHAGHSSVTIPFRGFQVVTVKLEVTGAIRVARRE
ncbi:glycoside hydrolase family 38 protein [Sphaerobolus stellatus SS14]|uniref:Alpha-mannosidase n=1 Tax=Sphaerobolus stellatus (strain SS14) TaxID=990650 RepID=A0A0C9UZF8_SPHS4|nr:glycoside hydrolase family 38 protein [Sphaerobolus stellatus SS14]